MTTEEVYAKVFTRLLSQAGLLGAETDLPERLCQHIARRVALGEISWSTAKQYASAIRWKLRHDGLGTDSFDRLWAEARGLSSRAKGPRKSTRRVSISGDVIATLRRLAAFRQARSFDVAASLFYAGTLLGLRPCEWSGTRWADAARTRLIVRNAKAASKVLEHGPFAGRLWVRGNGAERCLKLTEEGISAGLQDLVDEVLANEKEMPWSRHRSAIWRSFKTLVRVATEREMIPRKYRHLTLYSARHQFAADAKKAMDVRGGEVAAAMGHCAVRTAVSGYGRRIAGGSFSPAALPTVDSVAAVRNRALRLSRPLSGHPAPGPLPSG